MDETTYQAAVDLVVADQRRSYPDMSEVEAVEHVRNTIALEDVYDDHPGDRLAAAYRIVILNGETHR